ncbi:hypothetical protein B5C34_13595 [Pacificimonas flava]|uniref:Protein-L-isoaspartate O-methyltransferase n=2 Tax=Pacificimonas TaxID=1960290 RepID=A0A219B7M7_9SPHN|nr:MULTISPECIES: protein-L-isoaspartate O-methyltransferase [Pacificimonas]MBZ6379858.1 protein-L-isoaspartate O-methyltransferase [Pacificimonas aurantium]OWV34390.1 hypothetical protein B5C34_13595 [Pacificimonas flava]
MPANAALPVRNKTASPDFERMRTHMIDSQLRPNSVTTKAVVDAFREVPREAFVPEAMRPFAYMDEDIEVAPGRFLMEPLTLGRLIEFSEIGRGERALVVGGATGYAAAILAVMGVNTVLLDDGIEPAVAISRAPNIEAVKGPLADGWAEKGPYDLILVNGFVASIPDALVKQVVEGGRIAAVVLDEGTPRAGIGRVFGGHVGWTFISDAQVPALPGFETKKAFTF